MTMMQLIRRRRPTALLLVTVAAMHCFQYLTAPNYSMDGYSLDSRSVRDASYGFDGEGEPSAETLEEEQRFFRRFLKEAPRGLGGEEVYAGEEDCDAAAALARGDGSVDDVPPPEVAALRPYAMEDALAEAKTFDSMFCVLVYDPREDAFQVLMDKGNAWRNGNRKMFHSLKYVVYMLRLVFPERFAGPGSDELVLAFASGDFPHVGRSKLPRVDGAAPVLMFGSAFRDPAVYPNMIAMPLPAAHHLDCFEEWLTNGNDRVCNKLIAKTPGSTGDGKLLFGEEYGLEYQNLIPQLVWRGTDFGFLQSIGAGLQHPDSREIVPADGPEGDGRTSAVRKRAAAVRALMKKYDKLLPRWKGVALTAEAELNAKRKELPWANMKLSGYLEKGKGKDKTVGSDRYSPWESVGIGTGEGMSPEELATFRYHIDLGGGGGTTWSGTVEKLAMPGLLFHHVTPTKDYIHDRLTPWRHYVPVRSDLADLKAKFDWAESHQEEAKRIADAGTEFMRQLGTPEGFGRMFEEDFVAPLRRVIEAYRPVSEVHPEAASWEDVLQSAEDCTSIPVLQCTGITLKGSCTSLGGDKVAAWQKEGQYKGPK